MSLKVAMTVAVQEALQSLKECHLLVLLKHQLAHVKFHLVQ
jgi:hypothetical protein